MRFHEVPKRALFSIPFELANGLVIGIKGYGLVTEQKRGAYKYFVDLGDKMEVVESRTMHVDEVRVRLYPTWPWNFSYPDYFIKEREAEVNKSGVLFGMTLGATAEDEDGFGTRSVRAGRRVCTIRSLRFLKSPDVGRIPYRSSTQQKNFALCARLTLNQVSSSLVSRIVQSWHSRIMLGTRSLSTRTRTRMPAAGVLSRPYSPPW